VGNEVAELLGTVEVKVDDRNRVAIPVRFVEALRALSGSTNPDDPLEVVIGLDRMSKLAVFPKRVYEDFRASFEDPGAGAKSSNFSFVMESFRTLVLSSAEYQTVDKQGRIRLPQLYARQKGLQGDIVMQGVGDRLQLVSLADWEKSLRAYEEQVEELRRAEMRRVMGG
jgi:DNA-binding transcriptional regulator/RsmH inhibitor MraZ